MPLTAGTRIGGYEIGSAIGAGGMGEVYRARDTRLDRDVAIKILAEPFASDSERVARFEREAKTLAALSHRNIAIVHGVEDVNGSRALVMEPQLMLYDEPTSELDPVMGATISEIIATLKDQYHVTSIVVSHDRDLALGIAERIGILMAGKLVFLGPPSELQKPKDPRVADFLNPKIDLQNPRFKQLET
jgi:ABC-type proline/glycine betaine transport system ATPase subunit